MRKTQLDEPVSKPVNHVLISPNEIFYQIFINGVQKEIIIDDETSEEEGEKKEKKTKLVWEYDFNDFSIDPALAPVAEVEAHPENFMEYLTASPAMVSLFTDTVQKFMDDTAKERGYDNIFTAITYSNSINPKFKKEGIACSEWRDKVWTRCYEILELVQTAKMKQPTIKELIALLPKLEW